MTPGHDAARQAVTTGLRRARRRWFLAEWTRIAAHAFLLVALALTVAGALAATGAIPAAGLVAVLGLALGLAVLVTVARAWPLRRRPSDARLARFVEERCPELEDRLASAADILRHGERTPLAALVLREAATAVGALDLDRVVSRAVLGRRAGALLGGAAAALACAWWASGPLGPALDVLILKFAPGRVVIDVAPGSVSVAEGDALAIRARITGLLAFSGPVTLVTSDGQDERQVDMAAGPGGFAHELARVERDVTYSVRAGGIRTPGFQVTVRRAPRVARIDVRYTYPPFARLPARLQEDSGDIHAPAGSSATLTIHTTHPATGGVMRFATGDEVVLGGTGTRFEAPLRVEADASYRLVLRDSAGTDVPDETEYFIRVVDDRPPEVRIVRPAGDRRVTPLEELAVEVRADDDHGVDRLELVYAAEGKAERVVSVHPGGTPASVSGRATVYVEDLGVGPGDFITVYARARDVARGKRPTEVQSDIFFLEVRPFSEEFQLAQTQAFQASGGTMDDLAARQKEIVIATWKIERRAAAGRSPADIAVLARAQRELRERAVRAADAAAALRPARRRRAAESRPAESTGPNPDDPMQRATAAMAAAAAELERARPAQALPHEREALAWLWKARADVGRRQVARQQSGGGGRGTTGNEDLSALFDRELMRQQETNYESRSTLETRSEPKESAALSRLRELARRQDDLTRRQQELARQASSMNPAEVRRQLQRLTREQQELERIRQQLSNAARNMTDGGTQGTRATDLGQLQLEARESAAAARQLAGQLGAPDRPFPGGPSGRESAAAKQDELASRIDRLEEATTGAAARSGAARELRQAAGDLERQQLGDRLRREASALRQAAGAGRDGADRAVRETTAVAGALDALAERLAKVGGLDAEARQLSGDLARTRAAKDRLEQVSQEVGRASRQGNAGEADRLSREFAREARRSSGLMETLRDDRPELAEALATLEGDGVSRSAPGTEAFKQDFAAWDSLRRDVLLSLERLEASLAGRLTDRTDRGRVAAGADDRTTDAYRQHVDRYFRAIARNPDR